jgi:hypothetical protein
MNNDFDDLTDAQMAAAAAICRLCEGGTVRQGFTILLAALSSIIASNSRDANEDAALVRLFSEALAGTVRGRRAGLIESTDIQELLPS